MKLRVWRSFSCNNSSSYYLVARFETTEAAKASAKELEAFFRDHAEQSDAMWDQDLDPISTPTEAAKGLADKHGFQWQGYLAWGDEGLTDDEPHIYVIDDQVMLYHSYCGGFGKNIPAYFEKVGATSLGEQDRGHPALSIVFEIGESAKAKAAAQRISEYIEGLAKTAADEEGWVFQDSSNPPPWGGAATEDMEYECGEPYPCFKDGHSIGFVLEVNPREWEAIPTFLTENEIDQFRLQLDAGREDEFRTIAAAVCPECEAKPLRFVEASANKTPSDQLACAKCGGMFALSDFT